MIANKCVMASQRTVRRTIARLSHRCLEGNGLTGTCSKLALLPISALFRL